jgi:nodulation protein E
MTGGRSVVVTGLGAVSALGHGAAETWAAALEGRTGIAIHAFDPGEHGPDPFTAPAALVPEGYPEACEAALGRRIVGLLDRFALFSLGPAHEALQQAGLLQHEALDRRTAVVLGHGQGGFATMEGAYERFFGMKAPRVHPYSIPKGMLSAAVSAVTMQFAIHGPAYATSSACASSAHAILQGAELIRCGAADVAIVGGSEAMCTPGGMSVWLSISAMSKSSCRPFSQGRDGMVLGEGGAILVLEAREHAEARGAEILGEYLAGAATSDAFHLTQPSLEGPCAAMRAAAEGAGLFDEDEVLISAHGTGTPLNDQNEAMAIGEVFGEAARRHPVIATKSAHAHVLGGSPALQAVIGLQALKNRIAPPILNFLGPSPDCPLNLVVGEPRPLQARRMLLNAFAFGGLNVALAFGA